MHRCTNANLDSTNINELVLSDEQVKQGAQYSKLKRHGRTD